MSPPTGWRRHLIRDNPLCGLSGLARRRGSTLRVWRGAVLMALVSHGPTLLIVRVMAGSVHDDPEMLWIWNLLAPYFGAALIPAVGLALLPRRDMLWPAMADLRMTGLTPGQIAAGHLLPAARALWRFQALWILILVALLFHPRVWAEFGDVFTFDDSDAMLIWVFVINAAFSPWLMLALAWAVLVRWRRYSLAVMVSLVIALILNPFGMMLLLMVMGTFGLFSGPDEDLLTVLDLIGLLVKLALGVWALRWTSRHFDRLVAGE
jgi:hypothetical protein